MTARRLTLKPKEIGRIFTHYHFTLALASVFLLVALEVIFLYRYFWKTFNDTRLIVTLKKQAAVERVEIERFKKIEAFHEIKTKPREINVDTWNDPFAKQPSSTPSR